MSLQQKDLRTHTHTHTWNDTRTTEAAVEKRPLLQRQQILPPANIRTVGEVGRTRAVQYVRPNTAAVNNFIYSNVLRTSDTSLSIVCVCFVVHR